MSGARRGSNRLRSAVLAYGLASGSGALAQGDEIARPDVLDATSSSAPAASNPSDVAEAEGVVPVPTPEPPVAVVLSVEGPYVLVTPLVDGVLRPGLRLVHPDDPSVTVELRYPAERGWVAGSLGARAPSRGMPLTLLRQTGDAPSSGRASRPPTRMSPLAPVDGVRIIVSGGGSFVRPGMLFGADVTLRRRSLEVFAHVGPAAIFRAQMGDDPTPGGYGGFVGAAYMGRFGGIGGGLGVYSVANANIDVPATGHHAGVTATLRTRAGTLDGLHLAIDLTWEIVTDDPMGHLQSYGAALAFPAGRSGGLALRLEGITRSAGYIDFGLLWRQRLTRPGARNEVALRILPSLLMLDRTSGAVQVGVEVRRRRSPE